MSAIHEMSVTKDILKHSVKYAEANQATRILGVGLRVGQIRDLVEDIMQKYWDYLSRGTVAEGAKIKFTVVPTTFRCLVCGNNFEFDLHHRQKIVCPCCSGENVELLTGKELVIENIVII